MRFIGDVHGYFNDWVKKARKAPEGKSVQVGDFGVGFGKTNPPIFFDPRHRRQKSA